MVRLLLAGDVPGDVCLGRNLVHHAVIEPRFGPGHDDFIPRFRQAEMICWVPVTLVV